MFWHNKQTQPELSVSSCLGKNGYSLAAIKNNKSVVFSQRREFDDKSAHLMPLQLSNDVVRLNLIAHPCQLILTPGQYQLIVMDALDVPESEMAKALRWSLKGLSDYDLKDVAIDVFLAPGSEAQRDKKAFVAITPLSELNARRAQFESAFLETTVVTIAEMALKNLMTLIQAGQSLQSDAPVIVISLCNGTRTLHILEQGLFHLIRELTPSHNANPDEPEEWDNILFELARTIDYCVNKLNLAEPKELFFTPGFHRVVPLFKQIEESLNLTVTLIDLNHYLDMEPRMSLEEQHKVFYSITGALRFDQAEQTA